MNKFQVNRTRNNKLLPPARAVLLLRALIFAAGQGLSAVVVSVAAVLCIPMSSLTRARVVSAWARFNIWTLKHVCKISFEVSGRENIPRHPAVIIANHQSAWETLCFQIIFPPQSYILKSQLLWIPFFGWGLAANRPIAINRAKKIRAIDQLLTQGAARLNEGRWLVVFPEGTRRPPQQPGKFQPGGAMIAAHTGAPIVPVAHNAGVFWPKNSFIKHPGVVRVRIGAAIPSANQNARELTARAEQWIIESLRAMPQS